MSDRGMKKWAPYKSLIEHDPALNKMKSDRHKIDKPKISSEEAESINEILTNYHGQIVVITYYRNSELLTLEATIKKIDPIARCLILEEKKKITFSELISLKNA